MLMNESRQEEEAFSVWQGKPALHSALPPSSPSHFSHFCSGTSLHSIKICHNIQRVREKNIINFISCLEVLTTVCEFDCRTFYKLISGHILLILEFFISQVIIKWNFKSNKMKGLYLVHTIGEALFSLVKYNM